MKLKAGDIVKTPDWENNSYANLIGLYFCYSYNNYDVAGLCLAGAFDRAVCTSIASKLDFTDPCGVTTGTFDAEDITLYEP